MIQEDFIRDLQESGFTARIKRLSDSMLYAARKLYKTLDLDIEPNWHLIFLLLKKEEVLSITDISSKLHFSHPAIIKIIKKMKEKGYVTSFSNPSDSRKQMIKLSDKALKELPKLEEKWNSIHNVIEDLIEKDFLEKLSSIENQLATKSLSERVINELKNKQQL